MEKKHISLWVDEDVLGLCDSYLKMSKLKNRSEFIQEAIRLYCGYLENQISDEFVSKTLITSMQGIVGNLERRMSRLMFKQAVEIAKVFWLVVKGFHINPEDVDDFHTDCVEEVKRINGAIKFPFKSKGDGE